MAKALAALAPQGLSLYFHNVDGEPLEAAIGALDEHGRIVPCSMVSSYGQAQMSPRPRKLDPFVDRRLSRQGFALREQEAARPAFEAQMRRWTGSGELVVRSTVQEGLGALPQAFACLLKGATAGRALVRTDAEA